MRGTDPDSRPVSPFDHDDAAARQAQRKLMTLAATHEVALVIYNHDQRQWDTLTRAPGSYR